MAQSTQHPAEQNPGVPGWAQSSEKRPESEGDRTADRKKSAKDAATQRADKIAAAQIDPAAAAQYEALHPGPVYDLPDQAEGNPGVQGFVFRPHQEKNPGTGVEPFARDAFSDQVRQEKEARGRRWEAAREAAQKRGDTLPERVGPQRLRMHVDVSAHSVIEEDQLGAIAQAVDALVAALGEAGIRPQKAGVSGIPF